MNANNVNKTVRLHFDAKLAKLTMVAVYGSYFRWHTHFTYCDIWESEDVKEDINTHFQRLPLTYFVWQSLLNRTVSTNNSLLLVLFARAVCGNDVFWDKQL